MKTQTPFRFVGICSVTLLVVALVLAGAHAMAGDEKNADEKKTEAKKAHEKKVEKAAERKTSEPASGPRTSIIAKAAREKTPDVYVFTNDDLGTPPASSDRPAVPPGGSVPSPPAAATPNPLDWMQNRKEQGRDRGEMIAAAEKELAAARTKLVNLEKQLLAVVNPFSARTQLSDEEKEARATSGESAKQRYERTKELVALAKEEVAAAEENLTRARRQR